MERRSAFLLFTSSGKEMWAAPKPVLLWRGAFTVWPAPGPTKLTQNEALHGSFDPR